MIAAIPKLQRRVRDLEEFDPASLRGRDDPRTGALEAKLRDTIAEVFGNGTVEANRFASGGLDTAGYSMLGEMPWPTVLKSIQTSKAREIENLRTIIGLLQEKISDSTESPESRAVSALEILNLHPDVARACARLFADGHYAEAVENACKALDLLVKMHSMETERTGTDLMQFVFSPNSPLLRFNDLQTESDQSEQRGMMFLFAGAMLALRNPRAHGILTDQPDSALDYISFVSMLAKSLSRATRVESQ